MDEEDGNAMNQARMRALEGIALRYMMLHQLDTATYFETEEELKVSLEKEVEKLAPGCGHITR